MIIFLFLQTIDLNQDDWDPGGRPQHVPGLSLYDPHICGSTGNCFLPLTFLENESRFVAFT